MEFPGFFESELTLLAVNVRRMNSLSGYKMGYKITGIPKDFAGYCWTHVELNTNKNN